MNSLIIISGICYLIIGIFIGFFIATDRLIKSPEFKDKLEELREIRYEADRARTMHHVAKMMERVNSNLLLAMIDEFNKQVEAHTKKLKEEAKNAKNRL